MSLVSDQFSTAPTALGISSRLALQRLHEKKIDPVPLLRRSRLSMDSLNSRERICVSAQIEFLDAAAKALDDDCLGISLAGSYDLRELGMLYYVAASSFTLHDALRRLARYSRLGNEAIFGREKHGASCTLEFIFEGVQRHRGRQQIEFLAATFVRLCRQVLGRDVKPLSTSFVHFRSDDERSFYSLFGKNIQFGATADEMKLDPDLFALPLVGFDPFLNELMSKSCEEALSKHSRPAGSLRMNVENALAPLLPHGEARIEVVARRLGLGTRTLLRRLSKEGLRFAEIVEDLRRDLAVEYLREEDLQISQIAWLLGFRSPSAFTHSCQRWFGKPPSALRA